MRVLVSILVSLVIGIPKGSAAAQNIAEKNAAHWYQQAIDGWRAWWESSPAEREMLNNVFEYTPGAPVTPELRAVLARAQPIIESARRGAMQESCVFDLNREDGPFLLLPHLSNMRQAAKLIRVDALVRLHDGDPTAAADLISDVYRMSRHFGEDRIIISSLVGTSVFRTAEEVAQHAMDQGAFGPAESAILLEGLRELSAIDPMRTTDAMLGEKELFGGWLRAHMGNPEKRAEYWEMLSSVEAEEDPRFLLMSDDRMEAELNHYDHLMDRMVNAFNMPDRAAAKAEIAAVEDEIERSMQMSAIGGEGLLVGMFMPALGRVYENRERVENALANRVAQLERILNGEASPLELANAAIWYVRAAEMLDRRLYGAAGDGETSAAAADEESTAVVLRRLVSERATAGTGSGAWAIAATGNAGDAALVDASLQSIFAVLREGSQMGRCDFAFARPQRGLSEMRIVPAYLPALHDAVHLLHRDAARLFRAGDAAAALDRLNIALRLAIHLGDDPVLTSALTAQVDFNRTVQLIQHALQRRLLGSEHLSPLREALERLARREPFAYAAATVAARKQLSDQMMFVGADGVSRGQNWRRLREEAEAAAATLDADQTLFMLALLQTLHQNAATERLPEGEALLPDSLLVGRLRDVLSPARLEAIQQRVPLLGPRLAQRDLERLGEAATVALAESAYGASIADHAQRVPADVRRAIDVLSAPAQHAPTRGERGG